MQQKLCNTVISCGSDHRCKVYILYPWAQGRRRHFMTQRDRTLRSNICCLSRHTPPLLFRSLAPNPSAWPNQQVDGFPQRLRVSRRRRVQSIRTEFWTFTKSLSWISLLHQADYFSAFDLRQETISKSADTRNQTHLISTVKFNINLYGSKSFEHSDVLKLSTRFL